MNDDPSDNQLAIETETVSAIPTEVLDAVRSAEEHDIFPVAGYVEFDEQVLRCRTLSFASLSQLRFADVDVPFVAIYAEEILMGAPEKKATIDFPKINHPEDPSTPEKPPTPPRPGRSSRSSGIDGPDGTDGENGAPGASVSLPHIYLFTNRILGEAENLPPNYEALIFEIDGINGGDGGDGAEGGDGAKGSLGRHGRYSFLRGCYRSTGSGGDGGKPGLGGAGGKGGDAGSGADMTYVATEDALTILKHSRTSREAGEPGVGGVNGRPGRPGKGGARGSRPGTCDGGRRGRDAAELPYQRVKAEDGADGRRGRVFTKTVRDIRDEIA